MFERDARGQRVAFRMVFVPFAQGGLVRRGRVGKVGHHEAHLLREAAFDDRVADIEAEAPGFAGEGFVADLIGDHGGHVLR